MVGDGESAAILMYGNGCFLSQVRLRNFAYPYCLSLHFLCLVNSIIK